MRTTIKKATRLISFSFHEIITFALTAFVIGFVFSFRRWGVDTWDAFVGLHNLAYFTALAFILILVVVYLQKFTAAMHGFSVSFARSYTYLIIPIILSFFTNGYSLFFIPPGFTLKENLGLMLGRNRYRRGLSDYTLLGLIGTLVPTTLAIFFSTTFVGGLLPEFGTLIFLYVLFSLLPFDFIFRPFDGGTGVSYGSAIFYKSRTFYIYAFIYLASAYFMVVSESFVFTVLFAFVVSLIIALTWFLAKE